MSRATLSRTADRGAWAVIFRHPVRKDDTGKAGRRVRRGLGTSVEAEAQSLVDQLNQILSDPNLWVPSARVLAVRRGLDERVVDAFYDELAVDAAEAEDIREDVIPLPGQEEEYRRVLFLGTTGAGKTTLVRQLLGTHPVRERFPSTSTGRTTVADTEIILAPGPFRVVATFLPRDEVRELVEECLSSAALEARRGGDAPRVLRRILHHVDQRFRLAYVLGTGQTDGGEVDADEEEQPADGELVEVEAPQELDLARTASRLRDVVRDLRDLAATASKDMASRAPSTPGEDAGSREDALEEEFVKSVAADARFEKLVALLLEEVEARFHWMETKGELRKSKTGWPLSWQWSTDGRADFIRTVSRLTSNHARYFGVLLTPVVNGIRIQGPFKPEWAATPPPLVLIDGEGLGHTPDSSMSIPTSVVRRFEQVDAVLLVDNAVQPAQAVPIAVLRGLCANGYQGKLSVCFTHFEEVRGPNLPTSQDKRDHVRASLDNVLKGISSDLGPSAARETQRRLETRCFFVGGIQDRVDPGSRAGRLLTEELKRLLLALQSPEEVPAGGDARPLYDQANLVFHLQNAARKFQESWDALLGRSYTPGIMKKHWTKVRALTRRLAERWDDHYAELQPIADLVKELTEQVRRFIEAPLEWKPYEPAEEQVRSAILNRFAQEVSRRIVTAVSRRLWDDQLLSWVDAYSQAGRGSSYSRADIIANEIYAKAAPVPGVTPSRERTEFMQEFRDILRAAAADAGVELV